MLGGELGGCSQQLLCLNPTTVMIVLLLGCDNDYLKNWQIDGSVKISRKLIINGFCAEKNLVNYYIDKYI